MTESAYNYNIPRGCITAATFNSMATRLCQKAVFCPTH